MSVSDVSIRRHLLPLVIALVANVFAGLMVTPAAICQMRGQGAAAAAALVCTCGHSPDGQCAMHKHHKMPGAPTSQNRWCAGCQDRVDMIVTTLTGFAAPVPDRSEFARPDAVASAFQPFAERPLEFISPPLSPPPRS
jgi:hypothetical protein